MCVYIHTLKYVAEGLGEGQVKLRSVYSVPVRWLDWISRGRDFSSVCVVLINALSTLGRNSDSVHSVDVMPMCVCVCVCHFLSFPLSFSPLLKALILRGETVCYAVHWLVHTQTVSFRQTQTTKNQALGTIMITTPMDTAFFIYYPAQ